MGKIKKVSAKEMEIAIADWYGTRVNVIVPNVTWGLFNHECDLVVMTGSGYVTEIEIKVDKYDLKNDVKKKHDHEDKKLLDIYDHIFDIVPKPFTANRLKLTIRNALNLKKMQDKYFTLINAVINDE